MRSTATKRIGQILCERGYLTQSQLKQGLEKQKSEKKHRLLGQILVDLGYITQEQLSKAYLQSCGVR